MDVATLYDKLPDVLKPYVIFEGAFERKYLKKAPSKLLIQAALLKLGRHKLISREEAIHILTHEIPFVIDTETINPQSLTEDSRSILSDDDQESLYYRVALEGDYLKIIFASFYSGGSYCASYPNQEPGLYHIPTKTFERDFYITYDKYDEGLSTTFIQAVQSVLRIGAYTLELDDERECS